MEGGAGKSLVITYSLETTLSIYWLSTSLFLACFCKPWRFQPWFGTGWVPSEVIIEACFKWVNQWLWHRPKTTKYLDKAWTPAATLLTLGLGDMPIIDSHMGIFFKDSNQAWESLPMERLPQSWNQIQGSQASFYSSLFLPCCNWDPHVLKMMIKTQYFVLTLAILICLPLFSAKIC
jgi:hypothetical protein